MSLSSIRNPHSAIRNLRAFTPFPIPHSALRIQGAFTLLEVMIACAIFFMAVFAILQLVTTGLIQAKALQQREPDAGVLAATLSLTNQLVEGSVSGDFEEVAPGLYPGYRWSADINEVMSNGLFQVDYVVSGTVGKKHGLSESRMSILMFRPLSKPGSKSGGMGR